MLPAAHLVDKVCTREHYAEMLQVPSLNATKKLPGIVCFHIGMEVRLTTSILPPWAVQDTAGTIVDVEFAEQLPELLGPEHLLTRLPKAIYVQLEDVRAEFLPPTPCAQHTRYAAGCLPKTDTWHFLEHDGHKSIVKRTSYAIYPARACSLYTLQGSSCDPGLIAHFVCRCKIPAGVCHALSCAQTLRPDICELDKRGQENHGARSTRQFAGLGRLGVPDLLFRARCSFKGFPPGWFPRRNLTSPLYSYKPYKP